MVKTTVRIDGMMCGMCESHINDVIRKTFDVKKVKSSHTKNVAVVLSEEALDEGKMSAAIEETGYHYQGMTSEPYKKRGLFGGF